MDGYTRLYFKLIDEHRPGRVVLLGIAVMLVATFGAGLLAFLLVPTRLNEAIGLTLLNALAYLTAGALLFVGVILWHGSQNPLRFVPSLTARLLIDVPRPYKSDERGLTYGNLEHMLQVARSEQGAGDWRGSFVNIMLIGGVGATLALALRPELRSAFTFLSQFAGGGPLEESEFSVPALAWLSREQPVIEWLRLIMSVVAFILVLYLLVVLVFQIARLFFRYFRDEPINRATIFACGEARALLKANDLCERESLTDEEKSQLAKLCGFHAEPLEEPTDWRAWKLTPQASHQLLWRRVLARLSRQREADPGQSIAGPPGDSTDAKVPDDQAVEEARWAVSAAGEEE